MNSMFVNPICEKCNIIFKTVENLDVHMKFKHLETDHIRIDRRMEMARQAVSKGSQNIDNRIIYKCSGCEEVFPTKKKLKLTK